LSGAMLGMLWVACGARARKSENRAAGDCCWVLAPGIADQLRRRWRRPSRSRNSARRQLGYRDGDVRFERPPVNRHSHGDEFRCVILSRCAVAVCFKPRPPRRASESH
jgi:hypothetical protein